MAITFRNHLQVVRHATALPAPSQHSSSPTKNTFRQNASIPRTPPRLSPDDQLLHYSQLLRVSCIGLKHRTLAWSAMAKSMPMSHCCIHNTKWGSFVMGGRQYAANQSGASCKARRWQPHQ